MQCLSEREIEILKLVAIGLKNKRIVSHLQLATKTIQNHLRHIYATLGVENRTEAVTLALEKGIFKLEDLPSRSDFE